MEGEGVYKFRGGTPFTCQIPVFGAFQRFTGRIWSPSACVFAHDMPLQAVRRCTDDVDYMRLPIVMPLPMPYIYAINNCYQGISYA